MPNDDQATLSILDRASLLPGGAVLLAVTEPQDHGTFALASSTMFGSPPDAPIISPANWDQIAFATATVGAPGGPDPIFTLLSRAIPVAGLKYVFQFTDGVQGFSEVFAQNLNAIPANVENQIGGYIRYRLRISGTQTTFRRVRISVIGQRFSTAVFTAQQLLAGGFITQVNGTGGFASQTDSDSPDTTLVIALQSISGPPPAAARTRRLFLRGFPDYVNSQGGTYTPDGIFVQNMANFINIGIAGGGNAFGWFGQPGNGNNRIPITGLTNVNGQVNFVLAAPGIFGPGPTYSNVAVRVRGLVGGFRTLNGLITVTPNSAVSATSIRNWNWPVTGAPQLQTAQMYLQTTANFYPITGGGVEFIGERRAGRPFGQQAGRRPRVVRG